MATDQAPMLAKPPDIISRHHTSNHISACERATLGKVQADMPSAKLWTKQLKTYWTDTEIGWDGEHCLKQALTLTLKVALALALASGEVI